MKKIVFLLLVSLNVYAMENEVTASASLEPAIENTSEWARMNKKVTAHYQIDGGTFTGRGITLGYFLSRNQVAQIHISSLSKNFGESLANIFGSEVNVKGTAVEASYKHFLTNSFYLTGGLGYHEARIEKTDYGFIFPLENPEYFSMRGNALGFTVGIGNQWHIDNMTIGFNWVHASLPISSSTVGEKSPNSTDTESFERRRDYYFKRSIITASAYIGVIF